MNAPTMLPGFALAADEHAYWWNVDGEWVEPANERRGGWSGVLRVRHHGMLVYVKRQRNHLCRTLRHPFGWPTTSREYVYLRRLQKIGIAAPVPLFHSSVERDGGVESLLVTEALADFEPLPVRQGLDAACRSSLALTVGHVLGKLHRARLQHSCLYDKHVMVRWRSLAPEVALLDLEKMRTRATRSAAATHDLDQLRRHQDLWNRPEWNLLRASHREALNSPSGSRATREVRSSAA